MHGFKSCIALGLIYLSLGLTAGWAQTNPPAEEVVTVPDAVLRAVLEDRLGLAEGAPIRAVALARLTVLEAPNESIVELTGLESATGLTRLNLRSDPGKWLNRNDISDLAPLSGLTSLTYLNLENNRISDVSPLAGLTNLIYLNLENNRISDVLPLAGLTRLRRLHLEDNELTDVTPLAGLTRLTWLHLEDNELTDVSPLAGLTNLIWLNLRRNELTDVSPLAGLTRLTRLDLRRNELTDVSPLAGLTRLRRLTIDWFVDASSLSGPTRLKVYKPIRYPKLFLLNPLVEAYEDALAAGRVTSNIVPGNCAMDISPGDFPIWDPSKPAPSISVSIKTYTSESVDSIARFLEDHGISPRPIRKDEADSKSVIERTLWACVPVPLLGPLSEQPGVLRVEKMVPPVLYTPTVVEEESWGTIKNLFK